MNSSPSRPIPPSSIPIHLSTPTRPTLLPRNYSYPPCLSPTASSFFPPTSFTTGIPTSVSPDNLILAAAASSFINGGQPFLRPSSGYQSLPGSDWSTTTPSDYTTSTAAEDDFEMDMSMQADETMVGVDMVRAKIEGSPVGEMGGSSPMMQGTGNELFYTATTTTTTTQQPQSAIRTSPHSPPAPKFSPAEPYPRSLPRSTHSSRSPKSPPSKSAPTDSGYFVHPAVPSDHLQSPYSGQSQAGSEDHSVVSGGQQGYGMQQEEGYPGSVSYHLPVNQGEGAFPSSAGVQQGQGHHQSPQHGQPYPPFLAQAPHDGMPRELAPLQSHYPPQFQPGPGPDMSHFQTQQPYSNSYSSPSASSSPMSWGSGQYFYGNQQQQQPPQSGMQSQFGAQVRVPQHAQQEIDSLTPRSSASFGSQQGMFQPMGYGYSQGYHGGNGAGGGGGGGGGNYRAPPVNVHQGQGSGMLPPMMVPVTQANHHQQSSGPLATWQPITGRPSMGVREVRDAWAGAEKGGGGGSRPRKRAGFSPIPTPPTTSAPVDVPGSGAIPKYVTTVERDVAPRVQAMFEAKYDASDPFASTILNRPPQPYAALIGEALLSSPPPHRLLISDIFQRIVDKYPFYAVNPRLLYNGIRHAMTICEAFEKIPREWGDQSGKARKWGIKEGTEHWFDGGGYTKGGPGTKVERGRRHVPQPNYGGPSGSQQRSITPDEIRARYHGQRVPEQQEVEYSQSEYNESGEPSSVSGSLSDRQGMSPRQNRSLPSSGSKSAPVEPKFDQYMDQPNTHKRTQTVDNSAVNWSSPGLQPQPSFSNRRTTRASANAGLAIVVPSKDVFTR